MTARTWEDNAAEFGALSKQGVDVRLAALVACSVTKTKAGRPAIGAIAPIKASATAFASISETTQQRISRHLVAWEKCAVNGWCKPADDLTPDDVNATEVPTQEQFAMVFDATASGGRPRDSKPEDAAVIIEKRGAEPVVKAMTKAARTEMAHELRKAEVEDAEIAAVADGGRYPSLEEINKDAGNHPLDVIEARNLKVAALVSHMEQAHAVASSLEILDVETWNKIHPHLMAIFDMSPMAANL